MNYKNFTIELIDNEIKTSSNGFSKLEVLGILNYVNNQLIQDIVPKKKFSIKKDVSNNKIHMGKKLKSILNEKKISITGFSELIGVSRRTAYNIFEQEEINYFTLKNIEIKLNIKIEED